MKMWCVWLRILCVSAVGATSSRNVPIQTVLNIWIRKQKCFHELRITKKISNPLKTETEEPRDKIMDNGGLVRKPPWSLRVDGRKQKFSNTMMPYAIQRMSCYRISIVLAFSCGRKRFEYAKCGRGKNISVFKNTRTREQDTVNGKYCTCLEPRNEDPEY